MKDGLTWYRIYRQLCSELDILFPLKQSELSPRQNPIPANLEFHARNVGKKLVDQTQNDIAKIYYKLYRDLGEDEFLELHTQHDVFNQRCMEFPDRKVNISTVISVLYMSGYRGNTLYQKSLDYLKGRKT